MKLSKVIVSALAALALAAVGAQAQEILAPSTGVAGYNTGDLQLAFYSSSGTGDLVFDIGAASAYTGLAPGTYSVAGFNGSATAGQPAVGSGSADLTAAGHNLGYSASTNWTVAGGNNGNNQLWLTSSTASNQHGSTTQGSVVGTVDGIGFEASGNPNTNPASSFLTDKPYFNNISGASQTFAGGENAVSAVTAGTTSLALWSLVQPTSGSPLGTNLGFFTLNAGSNTLSFTVIPEPSTYAAILGALTIGFVMFRRKLHASGLSALA